MTTLPHHVCIRNSAGQRLDPTMAAARVRPETEKRGRQSTIAWRRKQLIHRRVEMESQWQQLFPRHAFSDMRLIRTDAMSGWDGAAWRKTARDYHDARKGRMVPREAAS
jgi:hypothetical protein